MKPLIVLACPMSAVGSVNAVIGALTAVSQRGHRVIFVIEESFRGKLATLGYEEEIYHMKKVDNAQNPGETWSQLLLKSKVFGDYSAFEKFDGMAEMFHGERNYAEVKAIDEALKVAIDKYKPDVLYQDGATLFPIVYYSGIPWVKNNSAQPLCFVFNDEIPPGCSGLPSDENRERYAEFNKKRHAFLFSKKYNDLVESMGYKRFPDESISPDSPYLNVYAYPDELNYPYFRRLNWFNLEVFHKSESKEVVNLSQFVPEEFFNDNLNGEFSGQWVYLSLGSMVAVDLALMKRLVDVLAKTNHKYIVSKGPRHSEYQLPRNMWGDRYLPQTKIIPLVDLVITHGGNNTTTETFAQGKPMIVVPLGGDQFDNSQRVHETGYGIRVDPYKFTEQELIDAVEKLLSDTNLHNKLQAASKRILSENRHELLADKIEKLVADNYSNF